MDRKREIGKDLWEIMQKVYSINPKSNQTLKQTELITKIVEYIDINLSTRHKRQDGKETKCLSEQSSS
jgi:hypothetical protein